MNSWWIAHLLYAPPVIVDPRSIVRLDTTVTDDKPMSEFSTAPRWSETSLEWLRHHWPMFIAAASGKRTAEERLHAALRSMSFRKAESEMDSASMRDYSAMLDELVAGWGQDDHSSMRDYLAEGGYENVKERLETAWAKRREIEQEVEVETVAELTQAEREALAAAELANELDDAVAEELRASDPQVGRW
jgi:predicted lipid-binding transport protein (Tim44 family)